MSTFKHLKVSLEGIEFQNGAFFKELVLVLGQHEKRLRASLNGSDFGKLAIGIDKVVKKHSGLIVNTLFEDFDLNGYVLIPAIDLNNPLWQQVNAGIPEGAVGVDWFVQKHKSAVKVNTSTGHVSGLLAKMKFKMGLAKLTYINGKLTDEQYAAMILHEIGHLFSFFEFLDKSLTTNAVLAELDKQLRASPLPKEREIILEKAGKALGFERTVAVDAAKSTDDKVVMTLYIGNAVERVRSETGSSWFDANTWETVADQYAVRQGAGASLAQALEIMYRGDTAASARPTNEYLIAEGLKLLRQAAFSIGGGGALAVGAVGAAAVPVGLATLGFTALAIVGYYAMSIGNMWLDGEQSDESNPDYASGFTRLQRVRQQMVFRAKQIQTENRPPEMQTQLLADITLIDDVLKSFHDRQSWLDTIAAWISTPVRSKQANIRFQRDLESLALNDLYVQSLSLATA